MQETKTNKWWRETTEIFLVFLCFRKETKQKQENGKLENSHKHKAAEIRQTWQLYSIRFLRNSSTAQIEKCSTNES